MLAFHCSNSVILNKYKKISSFEVGDCISNSSFELMKNKSKQFSSAQVNIKHCSMIQQYLALESFSHVFLIPLNMLTLELVT